MAGDEDQGRRVLLVGKPTAPGEVTVEYMDPAGLAELFGDSTRVRERLQQAREVGQKAERLRTQVEEIRAKIAKLQTELERLQERIRGDHE
jgi:predicted nuclease with TOPRIM domain